MALEGEADVFCKLWRQAAERGWDLHPAELQLLPTESIGLALMTKLIQQFDHERNLRVPLAVQTNSACMACWTLGGPSKALSKCACCASWALCASCFTKLEGNCFQCLYTDQKETAEKIKASRNGAAEPRTENPAAASAGGAVAAAAQGYSGICSMAVTPMEF